MKREINFIYIAAAIFIAVNTFFYYRIYKQQLNFQSDLLARQTQLCVNTLEQVGQSFENDLNAIPFADDFSVLFQDEKIMQRGSQNLQKLFNRYTELIDKITVIDNHQNVYSLILDRYGNIVSDYYESQQQAPLLERDQLHREGDRYIYTVPDFDDEGIMRSNISVEINYAKFVNSVFEQYGLEDILWQALVSEEGRLITTANYQLNIPAEDLGTISADILEDHEGSLTHSILVDSMATKVVSVYYPVWLIKRNLGVVFSIKSDLFLRSVLTKMIAITLSSLLILLAGIFFHHRLYARKERGAIVSGKSERGTQGILEDLPFGLLLFNENRKLYFANHLAKQWLWKEKEIPSSLPYESFSPGTIVAGSDPLRYRNALGPGTFHILPAADAHRLLYKLEWSPAQSTPAFRAVLLLDITLLENANNLERLIQHFKSSLIHDVGMEMQVPLKTLQQRIGDAAKKRSEFEKLQAIEHLQENAALLSDHFRSLLELSQKQADEVVLEEIPFFLRQEVELALKSLHKSAGNGNVSLITKIRTEVPDQLVGNPFRFRKVLQMLAGNAMDMTKEGRVLVSAAVKEETKHRLMLQFHVEDTGSGIPENLIDRFLRTMGSAPGDPSPSGSSKTEQILREARQQVALLKGRLWIESPSSISTDPDRPGSHFTFSMEVYPALSRKTHASFEGKSQFRDIHCLVLSQNKEADESKLALINLLGLNIKYLIYRQENLESALALIRQKSPDTDLLIITDDEEHDGTSLLDQAWDLPETRDMLMFFLTSAPQYDKKKACRAYAVDYYLESPPDPGHMKDILRHHFPALPASEMKKFPEIRKPDTRASILVVDDNLSHRSRIQHIMKALGFEIDLAENGAKALDMVKALHYDLIFMDLHMPELDGWQATREIRQWGKKMPIVALSVLDQRDLRQKSEAAGMNDFLVKPATEENIRQMLLGSLTKKS